MPFPHSSNTVWWSRKSECDALFCACVNVCVCVCVCVYGWGLVGGGVYDFMYSCVFGDCVCVCVLFVCYGSGTDL